MAIDEGRARALQTLGVDGVLVREQIPDIIRDCHEKMANAQAEAAMRHSGVYGQIWRKVLDRFETVLGSLPSAVIVPMRPYRLVSINGVVLFPWRYARDRSTDLESRLFAVSDTRSALFEQRCDGAQQRLDFEVEHPELTDEERRLLDAESALLELVSRRLRVVVVAYSSNPSAVHDIVWGEATLTADGRLAFLWKESLLDIGSGTLIDARPPTGEGFSDGPIPRPRLGLKDDEADGGAHG